MRAQDDRQRVAISDATVRRYAVTAVLLVTSLIFLVVGVGALLDQRRYQGNSQVAEGTVLTIRFKVPRRGAENPKSTTVTYEFQTEDGRVVRGSDLVSPRTRSGLREGGPVAVTYLADDPASNQIQEADEEGLYVLWIGIGLGFLAAGLAVERWIRSRSARSQNTVPFAAGDAPT